MFKKGRTVIAIPPGATIKEQLEDRGMTQKDFAARMDLTEKHISELINGKVQLTQDVARRLEMVFGISAQFWSNLETIYRAKLAQIENENEMDAEIKIARQYPYGEMSKNGWVPITTKQKERVINLRKFFEVVRLDLLCNDDLLPRIACRRTSITEKSNYSLVAWAQRAHIEARNRDTAHIDIDGLAKIVKDIRNMSRMAPDVFFPNLTGLLLQCGIALIVLPHIAGAHLHGATFVDGKKIVMGLTVRGKYADIFWFSLFHEIAHILHRHIYQPGGTSEEDENVADMFARDTLIAPDDYKSFLAENVTKDRVIKFAEHIGVNTGVVVGRLQNDGEIKYNRFNDLRAQYFIT